MNARLTQAIETRFSGKRWAYAACLPAGQADRAALCVVVEGEAGRTRGRFCPVPTHRPNWR